jgi:3-dehydroquinate synthase II
MPLVWVNADPWSKPAITAALETGADAVLIPEGRAADVHALGLITTVAPDGDLVLGADVVRVDITGKASEQLAADLGKARLVIVRATDWTVIPLENLIAAGAQVIAEVATADEAFVAAQTLESGTAGVLLTSADYDEIRKTVALLKSEAEQIDLQPATITEVRPIGMGDRVCVDTCSNMGMGEGMLVGNSSAALFLVHAESVDNEYVAARPFRVNAGPVHAYIRVPGGGTRYLSELAGGDEALIVTHEGHTRLTAVGRAKVERRPLLFVRAVAASSEVSVVLQNAETIRLVRPTGDPVSVVDLKPGDQVLIAQETAGRHFGMKIEETITER